jgi:hypothetical protein
LHLLIAYKAAHERISQTNFAAEFFNTIGRSLPVDLDPANGRNRRNLVVPASCDEGLLTIPICRPSSSLLAIVNRANGATPLTFWLSPKSEKSATRRRRHQHG